ncbi:mechanosensitive ion channel family protein [Cellulomonas chengniuliangii]|uniref:mechanosensitive ion channel family protein n=1 Tax=Cellulomonas chengniuliangii TaxID=2968084 RepID=UPI001D0E5FE4|nr:mechanosensitive ion channel domain-containing protein [Cellulomonas chengniuliangii]MCC2318705.1 mechanosensitive ion channel family protein [Cellulomonas chengniuliangii]
MPEETIVDNAGGALVLVLALVAAVVVAFVAAGIVAVLTRAAVRRHGGPPELTRKLRKPLRANFLVMALWTGLRLATEPARWTAITEHVLLVIFIATLAWIVGALAFVAEDVAMRRFRVDVPDNRTARRVRTQVALLRRLTVVVLVLCAAAGILMTFPGARGFGASLLASAGLLSIVAGLAAQSSLANLFAGVQLAFTNAIRVDDVVVVAGEWGRIEEITLSYVVVHVWDDRRLIIPSTHFTTTPFENWTRRATDLVGVVELDLDWEAPIDEMRGELARILAGTDLWDKRVGVLQVTDATQGNVRVRVLASAVDAPTLFDLRCHVRERLVAWLQREAPQGLPRSRTASVVRMDEGDRGQVLPMAGGQPSAAPPQPAHVPPRAGHPAADAAEADPGVFRHTVRLGGRNGGEPAGADLDETQVLTPASEANLFTGSLEALGRSRAFSGPGEAADAERVRRKEARAAEAEAEARAAEPNADFDADDAGSGLDETAVIDLVEADGRGGAGAGSGSHR